MPDMADREKAIGKLTIRFGGGANANEKVEAAKIALLIEDTASLSAATLDAAIREGVLSWEYMPTAAKIIDAAKPIIAEQRDAERQRAIDRQMRDRAAAKALPAPEIDNDHVQRILAATVGKLSRGDRHLRNMAATDAPFVPLSEQPLAVPERGTRASDELKRVFADMQARRIA